ncbi:MAG: hypothetical protein VB949_09115 [Pseudomonadales bacterium]
MTLRHQAHYTNDNDSLQTDVMRFMAIIGFCLMAVLAVVRNVEPTVSPVAAEPKPAMDDAIPVPETVEPEQIAAQPPLQSEPQPDSQQTPQAERGLSLRFATDRDFLRLVTKGEIHVYAYKAHTVLGLDRNFDFLSAEPPGRVYELLPETIPSLIFAALGRATSQSNSYTWGVRMPRKLEGKIRHFVERGVHGELVIDRYGEVHHVPS